MLRSYCTGDSLSLYCPMLFFRLPAQLGLGPLMLVGRPLLLPGRPLETMLRGRGIGALLCSSAPPIALSTMSLLLLTTVVGQFGEARAPLCERKATASMVFASNGVCIVWGISAHAEQTPYSAGNDTFRQRA